MNIFLWICERSYFESSRLERGSGLRVKMIEQNSDQAINQPVSLNADIVVSIENKSSPSSNDRLPYKTIVNDSGYVDLISNSDSLKNTTVSQYKVDLESSLDTQSHGGPSPVQSESPSVDPERSLRTKSKQSKRRRLPKLDTPCKRISFIVGCISLALALMAAAILIIIFGISKPRFWSNFITVCRR